MPPQNIRTPPEDHGRFWQPCPRCGSDSVQTCGTCFWAIAGLVFIAIGIVATPFLFFIGIPIVIVGILTAIASPLMALMLRCGSCNHIWRYRRDRQKSP